MEYKILLVEDTVALARTYKGFLRDEPYIVQHLEKGGEALEAIGNELPDAVVLDLRLPDMNGMEVLEKLTASGVACPVIVITAHGSMRTAVEAMQAGASDFLVKPFSADRLKVTLKNVLEKQQLIRTVETYRDRIDRRAFEGFVGSSLAMQAVYRAIESAAASDATVFVTGESGTGKELCAQAIHRLSKRRAKALVPINCAAIPKDLMESEIFGHVKGAFTGAHLDREGAASLADGGTMFLDEICEMDMALQSKLLRFIQSGSFTKVGGARPVEVDIRFVCATNRDPFKEVAAGRFREDLYYRLHVVPIRLPPLRERAEDVLEIADILLKNYAEREGKAFCGFDDEARALITAHSWPGNVRELQNALRQAVVLHQGEQLSPEMLPDSVVQNGNRRSFEDSEATVQEMPVPGVSNGGNAMPPESDLGTLAQTIRPLDEVERETIERAINLCGGDVRTASVLLGIAPATIYRKRKAWNS
ncbi:sigma-54-dependent transcriptional regulator [Pelagibius litoralis]|uniref:sigma-54-dependent transcriptional regulator n=1 Tax=Pelagibius litoralis TaxID=374515 RepID=UPI001F1045B0|nr:sigma-54 dependent transcriptional regulator [Pelagibius litoralis]